MITIFCKQGGLRRLLGILLLMVFAGGSAVTHAEPDAEDTWADHSEEKALQVNEGELIFLPARAQAMDVHHHHNRIILHPSSLLDGWITLQQCHRHIDTVSEAQIVFHKERIRDLKIDSYRNISRVWVAGHTVQLRGVLHDAELCITGRSKALSSNQDGTYVLQNGPFMRRFLDGYYPMHVTMDIIFPANCLHIKHMSPQKQSGFEVWQDTNRLSIDAWFEGRLLTIITFSSNNNDEAKEHCT